MKSITLLLSVLAISAMPTHASSNALGTCKQGMSEQACEMYIEGLVDGYLASKQNYLPKQPVFDSAYLARAYANRVGKSYSTLQNKQPACLPSVVDKQKIVQHLAQSQSELSLTEQLGNYLRTEYSCSDKLVKK